MSCGYKQHGCIGGPQGRNLWKSGVAILVATLFFSNRLFSADSQQVLHDDPELLKYQAAIRAKIIQSNTLMSDQYGAIVKFSIDQNGNILNVSLEESSENKKYDKSCLKAINKISPLPLPPDKLKEEVFKEGFMVGFGKKSSAVGYVSVSPPVKAMTSSNKEYNGHPISTNKKTHGDESKLIALRDASRQYLKDAWADKCLYLDFFSDLNWYRQSQYNPSVEIGQCLVVYKESEFGVKPVYYFALLSIDGKNQTYDIPTYRGIPITAPLNNSGTFVGNNIIIHSGALRHALLILIQRFNALWDEGHIEIIANDIDLKPQSPITDTQYLNKLMNIMVEAYEGKVPFVKK